MASVANTLLLDGQLAALPHASDEASNERPVRRHPRPRVVNCPGNASMFPQVLPSVQSSRSIIAHMFSMGDMSGEQGGHSSTSGTFC